MRTLGAMAEPPARSGSDLPHQYGRCQDSSGLYWTRYISVPWRYPVKMPGRKFPRPVGTSPCPAYVAPGSLPATMDGANGDTPPRGVLYAHLIESHPDRIVVGDCTVFLGDGMACSY